MDIVLIKSVANLPMDSMSLGKTTQLIENIKQRNVLPSNKMAIVIMDKDAILFM